MIIDIGFGTKQEVQRLECLLITEELEVDIDGKIYVIPIIIFEKFVPEITHGLNTNVERYIDRIKLSDEFSLEVADLILRKIVRNYKRIGYVVNPEYDLPELLPVGVEEENVVNLDPNISSEDIKAIDAELAEDDEVIEES